MDRSKQIVRVSLIGIAANLVLVAFKAAVGFVTGSIAVILDAVNNLSDALSSVITILGTKLANRPPDKEHPYGYGRIEHLTSVVIAILVLAAGVTSLKESAEKIFHPEAADYTVVSLIIIAAAVAVKYFLGTYVKNQGDRLSSESLIASGTDARFDSLISFSTLVAAAVSMMFHLSVEGYLGVVIAILILKAGLEILLESLNGIIGQRVEGELAGRIKEAVCSFPHVKGAYDLILHKYGPERTIGSVHIEVPDTMTAAELHPLNRAISQKIYDEFGVILTVGIYASAEKEGPILTALREVLKDYPAVKQLHGFYILEDKKRVTFDLVLDFGADTHAVCADIARAMKSRFPDYDFDVVPDSDFSE